MATETLNLRVHGMTCDNCAHAVQNKIGSTPGVTKVTVDLAGGAATVQYDIGLVKPEAIANAVRSLGYEVAV
jgi:copper chaperone CopZ